MIRELKNAVEASDRKAQYDECAKRFLGQKFIIASILSKSVEAFLGMAPKDIIPYIEGEPYIGKVPVEPGLTNAAWEENGQRVVGLNTENQEINEGLVRFDVICYVRLPERDGEKVPDGEKKPLTQIIINLEMQKDQPREYQILNRAVFYVSRQISAQKERDFTGSHYDDIKSVYSIWICMNMEENSMSHIHLTKEDMMGSQPWRGGLDLFHIVMIGIGKDLPGQEENYELHRFLGTIFSQKLAVEEKLHIMKTEYDISEEEDFREDVNEMCNLGEGIMEEGIAIGMEKGIAIGETKGREEGIAIGETRGRESGLVQGREEGIAIGETKGISIGESRTIRNMHKNGFTAEQIAAATDKALDEVKAILAQDMEGLYL